MSDIIIFSPHSDDEIIGCYRILDQVSRIIYFDDDDNNRVDESKKFCEDFNAECEFAYTFEILNDELYNFDNCTIYAPDPFGEHHPLHREVGMAACLLNSWKRIKELYLYSTDMTQPWVREVPDSFSKKELLNKYYSSQRDLWTHDYKYFLFQGTILWP